MARPIIYVTVTNAQGPVGATGPPGAPGAPGSGSADTAAQILAKLVTVDGSGSGLDADTLDGLDSSGFLPANAIGVTVMPQPSIVIVSPTTGSIVIDMAVSNGNYLSLSLTGDPSLSLSNRVAGRNTSIRIVAGASARTFTFPPGWSFVGTKPTTIAADKVAVLALTCFDTTEAGVLAAYSVQAA